MSLIRRKVAPAGPYASLDALFESGVREQVQADLQKDFDAEIRTIVEGR